MSSRQSEHDSNHSLSKAKELAIGLYPHQVDGVAFLLARRRAILADDMGLGKTRQSLVAMKQAEPDGPWLIICPASVKRNWEREIRLAFDTPQTVAILSGKSSVPAKGFRGWLILNYDIVKKHLDGLCQIRFRGFICDEAHYLKNHRTQRSKATRKLIESTESPVVHCLTGTPMTNRPSDLFPLLQLVEHPLGKSFLGFARRYCDAKKGEFGWDTKGASNLDELTLQLDGTLLRRTKDEVLDLPGKMRTWLTVDVPIETARRGTRRVVATLLKRTSNHATEGDQASRLPPISRQKLLARLQPIRSSIAGAKFSHTLEFARGILDQGEKVVIFSCFQELVETHYDAFEEYGVRWMTGGTSADDRQQAIDDFQTRDDVRVFFATLIAGGVGINLTAARHMIFNDLDWVPANHWQAEDRAYRIGQKHPVNVYYFIASKSIDEFIGVVLKTKSDMIRTVVDGETTDSPLDGGGNVLSELEDTLNAFDHDVSDSRLDSLVAKTFEFWSENDGESILAKKDPLHKPKQARLASLRALAKAIEPIKTKRFRVAGSKSGTFYELEVIGSDIVCSCRGFEFRGQCKHARQLKDAIVNEAEPPECFEQL
ncbi:MAG: DEAD/DEAH box helicase [Planctomycetota bacterium]